jgi:CO/xanthine dehydrogenase FAD-binding subunit
VPFIVSDTTGTLADPLAGIETKKRLLRELMKQASPISDVRASQDYRQAMVAVLAERALEKAIAQLKQ